MPFWDVVGCLCPRGNRIVHPEATPQENVPATENNAVIADEPKPIDTVLPNSESSPAPVSQDETIAADVEAIAAEQKQESDPIPNGQIEAAKLVENSLSTVEGRADEHHEEENAEEVPKEDREQLVPAEEEFKEILSENEKVDEETQVANDESHDEEHHEDPVEKTLKTAAEIIKKLSEDVATITPESEADVDEIVAELAQSRLENATRTEGSDQENLVKSDVEKLNGALLGFKDSEIAVAEHTADVIKEPEPVAKEPKKPIKQSAGTVNKRRQSKEAAKVIKVKAAEVRELPKKQAALKNMEIPRMKKDSQVKFKDDSKKLANQQQKGKKEPAALKKRVEESEESQAAAVPVDSTAAADAGQEEHAVRDAGAEKADDQEADRISAEARQ